LTESKKKDKISWGIIFELKIPKKWKKLLVSSFDLRLGKDARIFVARSGCGRVWLGFCPHARDK
jgi:hypothetical protein